jgi:cytochrome P450
MLSDAVKLPPGPTEPFDESGQLLDWMEDHRGRFGDIFRAQAYGSNVYVISRPGYIQHVLRGNWQNYRKGHSIKRVELLLGRGLISSEGTLWRTQRRLIQPAFHERLLAELTRTIADANAALGEKWERAAIACRLVNITHDISVMVLELVLALIFGEDYHQVATEFRILAEDSARDLKFADAFRPLRNVVAQVAARRREIGRTAPDFLGMLMEARDRDSGEAMSAGQLVTEIMTLVVAGHETTALTLNWVWHLLSGHPRVDDKLSRELSGLAHGERPDPGWLHRFPYCKSVIDETLRLYPPVWLITRRALNDDELDGYFIPARTEIYISPYVVQRHPDLWREPDRFDPDRFDRDRPEGRHALAMLPFAAGPRNCVGEGLARLESQVHLAMIAKKLRLREVDARPVELDPGVNLRGKHDFMMMPEIRRPADLPG